MGSPNVGCPGGCGGVRDVDGASQALTHNACFGFFFFVFARIHALSGSVSLTYMVMMVCHLAARAGHDGGYWGWVIKGVNGLLALSQSLCCHWVRTLGSMMGG